ncbi:t-SNARE [Guyanagaster necrorhizus]|uniref:t-SNARE n=1 Tax=Guyanagaster necrorhizus TaxID=856835 RepID=A0A9P7W4P0_9AGAR|nr:t-SNARE [Guyanagaster necrorhizus MCA 3950]KAG7452069.1 t-SNARE [Guyanagaster necrorhizus MCA 3950]
MSDRLAAYRSQRPEPAHELSNLTANGSGSDTAASSRADFLSESNEITSLQVAINNLTNNVRYIAKLHTRSLSTTAADEAVTRELAIIKEETSKLQNDIRDRIAYLANQPGDDMRVNQTKLIRKRFMEVLQDYRRAEQDFTNRSKQRVGRQFRVVKPDATDEEVKQVIDASASGTEIFSEAVLASSYGEARSAYREVQSRQQDLAQMERTMAELAQLFNDMQVIVEQHDDRIKEIEHTAQEVNVNTEKGTKLTEEAVRIARRIRKKKWICFWICVFIVALLALILGLYFGEPAKRQEGPFTLSAVERRRSEMKSASKHLTGYISATMVSHDLLNFTPATILTVLEM